MNPFKGLKPFEAVAIEDVGFMAQFPTGEYYSPLRGEGNPLVVSGYDGQQFVFKSLDGIYRLKKQNAVLVGYTDADGNPVGSVEEKAALTKQLEELLKQAGQTGIANIDAEFDLRKKLAVYRDVKSVHDYPPPLKEPIEFKIVGEFKETGSQYIISSYAIGELGYNTSGPYKLFQSSVAHNELAKLMDKHPGEITNSTHSNIRYAKVGPSYIFTSADELTFPYIGEKSIQIFRSLELAKAKEEEIRQTVRRAVKAHIKPKSLNDLDGKTVTDIIAMVDSITSNVRQTQPMKASRSANNTAYQKCRELMELLRTLQDD